MLTGPAELSEGTRHPPTAAQIGEYGSWATKWQAYNDMLKICVQTNIFTTEHCEDCAPPSIIDSH